jgi:hypothetical protein
VAACKKIVELFLSHQFVRKNVVALCVCFLCYKVASYKVVVAFNFGGNHMLLQVNRMVKTLKIE